mgnify:CR=1 FL=1
MTAAHDSGTTPAADFLEVWDLLDQLPRGSASAALAATTVELAAVEAAPRAAAGRRAAWVWLGPAAAVAAAFVAGLAAGRVTAPHPDLRILEQLPLVRHLDLLEEAGSVRFLEALRDGRHPQAARLLVRQGPEARERGQFETRLEALRGAFHVDPGSDPTAFRRRQFEALPEEERETLRSAAADYAGLDPARRRGLAELAGALVDPARGDLREAAALWHQWLRSLPPSQRSEIIAAGTDRRLEWIDYFATRIDQRLEGRPPRGPDGRPRWPPPEGPGDGPRGAQGFDGPPHRPPGPQRPPRDDRGPFRPDRRPRQEFPAEPAETPAPPN